ncbi:hypothetical protein BRARA_D00656 [Brassica rapa]|uniref:Uncharacterized protein n=1 Tax=Brassica campestris TaxID=3711 RepID=A0A397ZJ98_BRACM|nr:hypothetical protein BRARA_D00656 [Brassica rapa]
MADNIRRALQDINFGADDAPFVLPPAVVRQAEEESRFILIGRLVMPHKQNLRAVVTTMPRNWGFQRNPLQLMNIHVIVHIVRALGEYIQMDCNEEVGSRFEFVRIQLNWNVNHPLRVQRNFQFSPRLNTFMRL